MTNPLGLWPRYAVCQCQNFRAGGTDNIFAQCTAVNTAGNTCAWSYNGTALNSIDISTKSPAGAAADSIFSLVVWIPA